MICPGKATVRAIISRYHLALGETEDCCMFSGMTRFIAFFAVILIIASIGGIYAAWYYGTGVDPFVDSLLTGFGDFKYPEAEMPSEQVTLLQRLDDILNCRYSTDIVTDSRAYLLDETIQVYWEEGAEPYVGSMDLNFQTQIDALFGDIRDQFDVEFILKNEDLNWDGYSEIAMYSTSDPLDCQWDFDGIVCVYVSVFAPVLDENREIAAYELICESMRGYCFEVMYSQVDKTPSFSTDEWKDDLGYYCNEDGQIHWIPDDTMNADGTALFKYDYNSYNYEYNYEGAIWPGRTYTYGHKLYELIWDKLPWLAPW